MSLLHLMPTNNSTNIHYTSYHEVHSGPLQLQQLSSVHVMPQTGRPHIKPTRNRDIHVHTHFCNVLVPRLEFHSGDETHVGVLYQMQS